MVATIVIIGGGIAATSCLEALVHEFCPDSPKYKSILLISASRLLKRAVNYNLRGRNLESFDVTEIDMHDLSDFKCPKELDLNFVLGHVKCVNTANKTVAVNCDEPNDKEYRFDILSICTGSSPNDLNVVGYDNPNLKERLITIRDTTSVETLKQKLASCRRIALIGNGGISLELAYRISNCEKIWIVRDEFIGHPFLDSEASKFVIGTFNVKSLHDDHGKQPRFKSSDSHGFKTYGPALGPYWLQQQDLRGVQQPVENLKMVYQREIEQINVNEQHDWPLCLTLTGGQKIECDFLVSAIGVLPNTLLTHGDKLETSANDGGIIIDEQMRTSLCDIYAAGDVVSCERWPKNTLWFQMRLWTQARQMGHYCGRSIASHLNKTDPSIYFNFDCFTHSTSFFGKKIVLLGRYNLQNEPKDELKNIEIQVRVKADQDYVKLVIREDRVIGAILVGDSGLDETIENLIYDQIDIGPFKHQLLDETVDIDDFFD